MREEKNEFLGLLCNLYIVALLVVLPLYTGEGYGQLGITKYVLFRNISLLCIGCWLVLGIPGRIRVLVGEGRRFLGGRESAPGAVGRGGRGMWAAHFGITDCAVAAYGICVVLSASYSGYKRLAWLGFDEWYMGAVSQLLFVGIYFFVSRQYNGAGWPLYLGEGAIFLVSVLGLLHKLGIDPLGLQKGWNSGDWVYSHMLSTLGNINWLCGFYSVALAFTVSRYLREEGRRARIPLYLAAVAAFLLLGVQGSQGGLLIIGVCVCVCLAAGWRQAAILKKLFMLLGGFFLCMPLMDLLMDLRGNMAAVVADGDIFAGRMWYEWLAAAAVCLGLAFFFGKRERGQGRTFAGRKGKLFGRVIFPAVAGLCVAAGICVVLSRMDDSFGSGRGFLWRIALEGFGQADLKDKMLGAGPDCFGAAVFSRLGAGTDVWKGDHWEGSVFTNAHNEILNQLCNVGILGTVSYVGIFAAGLRRYRKMHGNLLGVLALSMYGAHSLISFQQVLNAPLLFLALGLCEREMREAAGPGAGRNREEPASKGEEAARNREEAASKRPGAVRSREEPASKGAEAARSREEAASKRAGQRARKAGSGSGKIIVREGRQDNRRDMDEVDEIQD